MPYKAIIFDYDGVIFASEKIHFAACNKALAPLEIVINSKEYLAHYIGLSDNEMFKLIFNKHSIDPNKVCLHKVCQQKIIYYQNIINGYGELTGISGINFFINKYAQHLKFAICSGSSKKEIQATLPKLENGALVNHFKHIVTVDDVASGKPSPQGYLLAAKLLQVAPADCLVIEDTPKGILAAKNAGMEVVALTTTYERATFKDFKNIKFIANNYHDIDAWLVAN